MFDPNSVQATPSVPINRLVEEQLVRWYFLAGLGYLALGMLGGIFYGLQLIQLNPFDGTSEYLSPGRWRMIHTNLMAYGFIANCFLGALHYAVPRLTLHPVLSTKFSYFIFAAWQAVVLATIGGLMVGEAQSLEWGETPVWIDPLALVGLGLVAVNFMAPIGKVKGPMYVTLWYFTAAYIWTVLTYAMGNFVPQYFVNGTAAGAVGGLFIHDLVGLFVTPIGWGLMYYMVPIILKKPMWSHGLSLVGFWGLAFFYPLTGIHHFLYTPIPMFLQYGAIVSTVAVELVVTTVLINFFATIWGSTRSLVVNVPIRFFYTGMILYFLTCLQCAFQTTLTFQALIHFTDWVVGHAHMVMFGVFGLWLYGTVMYMYPRVVHRPWFSKTLNEANYWLSTVGIVTMSMDLIVGGLFQGQYLNALKPWEDYISISVPFWVIRMFSGLLMFAGLICLWINILLTSFGPKVDPVVVAASDSTSA